MSLEMSTVKLALIIFLLSFVPRFVEAQTVTLQSPIIWHTNKVDNAAMNKRVEEAAEEFKQYAPIPRIAFFDIGYPKDKAEFEALNGYAVLLISALSQDESELPLKKVYVSRDGKVVELKALKVINIKEPSLESRVAKTFGIFRTDSIFLFPIHVNAPSAELLIDFNKNRTGMRVATFDGILPSELKEGGKKVPVENKKIDDALKLFMKREYPGYLEN